MAQPNRISVNISEPEMADILAAIATLQTKLVPHLQSLSAADRIEIPKMGDKTVGFVEKALDYGRLHPDLVPSFLDLKALETDVRGVATLRGLARRLAAVTEPLDDSILLSGSEAYQGALVFYGNVKNAARVKVPGAQSIVDDLAARFPGGTKR